MLAVSCFTIAVAQLMQGATVIPIEYRRPSQILRLIEPVGQHAAVEAAVLTPDDEHGTLVVHGSRHDAAEVRKLVAMFDIPRQRAEISVNVNAPTDKLRYHQTAELYGGETWTSEESELGIKMTITVEPQLGKTVTLRVQTEYRNHKSLSICRLKLGQSINQSFGRAVVDDPVPGVHLREQTPIVTFKFAGLHGG